MLSEEPHGFFTTEPANRTPPFGARKKRDCDPLKGISMGLGVHGVTTPTTLVLSGGTDTESDAETTAASTTAATTTSAAISASTDTVETTASSTSGSGVYTAQGLVAGVGVSPAVVPSGNPSTWTEAQIQAMTASDIASLTQTQLSELSATQMGWFTTAQMADFSTTQLGWLTATQVAISRSRVQPA